MDKKYVRKSPGIIINKDRAGYNARMVAKKNIKNQQSQSKEIKSLMSEIEELKQLVNKLILDK
jgi:hypothetical protein